MVKIAFTLHSEWPETAVVTIHKGDLELCTVYNDPCFVKTRQIVDALGREMNRTEKEGE